MLVGRVKHRTESVLYRARVVRGASCIEGRAPDPTPVRRAESHKLYITVLLYARPIKGRARPLIYRPALRWLIRPVARFIFL